MTSKQIQNRIIKKHQKKNGRTVPPLSKDKVTQADTAMRMSFSRKKYIIRIKTKILSTKSCKITLSPPWAHTSSFSNRNTLIHPRSSSASTNQPWMISTRSSSVESLCLAALLTACSPSVKHSLSKFPPLGAPAIIKHSKFQMPRIRSKWSSKSS